MQRSTQIVLGLNGMNTQTPAVQALLRGKAPTRRRKKTTRRKTRKSPRRKTRTKRAAPKRRATRRTKKPAYMVKGSPAAKRHMAKLRRMRRK